MQFQPKSYNKLKPNAQKLRILASLLLYKFKHNLKLRKQQINIITQITSRFQEDNEMRKKNLKLEMNWNMRDVQISRGSSIAANSCAQRRNDPNHHENQGCHKETHVDFSSMLERKTNSCNEEEFKSDLKFDCGTKSKSEMNRI